MSWSDSSDKLAKLFEAEAGSQGISVRFYDVTCSIQELLDNKITPQHIEACITHLFWDDILREGVSKYGFSFIRKRFKFMQLKQQKAAKIAEEKEPKKTDWNCAAIALKNTGITGARLQKLLELAGCPSEQLSQIDLMPAEGA